LVIDGLKGVNMLKRLETLMVDWFSNGVKHAMMELVSSVVD